MWKSAWRKELHYVWCIDGKWVESLFMLLIMNSVSFLQKVDANSSQILVTSILKSNACADHVNLLGYKTVDLTWSLTQTILCVSVWVKERALNSTRGKHSVKCTLRFSQHWTVKHIHMHTHTRPLFFDLNGILCHRVCPQKLILNLRKLEF